MKDMKKGYKPVPLQQWSDVIFLQWQHIAGENVETLRYIFQPVISNAITQNIVMQALGQLGKTLNSWKDKVTIPMNTKQGQAIFGSPNGNGAGWLLINHKDASLLDIKTIESVTIWSEDLDNTEIEMYFTIV